MKIGRTFGETPDIGDLGQYSLSMIIDGSGDALVDFGSRETLEWGYGNYGLVFEVPSDAVHTTDTPDYPIECAFEIESAQLIGAYYREGAAIDTDAFQAAVDDYAEACDYGEITVAPLVAELKSSGWMSRI